MASGATPASDEERAGATRVVAQYWRDDEVAAAVTTLRNGGLLLAKGDIGYGLFGTSEDAIRRMYALKGRPYSNPCIFIGDGDVLDEVAEIRDPRVRRWIDEVSSWTTCAVVLPEQRDSAALAAMDPWVRRQSVTDGTLAVFLRTGPFLAEVVRALLAEGIVFVGSSANRSFEGNRYDPAELPPDLLTGADLFIDHGTAALANRERLATTMVNFTNWTIRRMGVNGERIAERFHALRAEVGAGNDEGV